jgi:CheY-like chemotaxis protein
MLGWIKLVRSGVLEPETQQRGIEIIERNTLAQTRLIEDLLDISRVISGKLTLDIRSVSVLSVIEVAMDTVAPAAVAKDIVPERVFEVENEVARGDPDRLQQVVYNLLTNAIKFTSRGGRVAARVRHTDSQIEVIISDTGIGIEPGFLPYLFERFRQEDTSTTRQCQGLGLGLAIARHLIELHGGTIRAESQGKGQGATFTVRLPVGALNREAALETRATIEGTPEGILGQPVKGDLKGLRVLVVEDEPDSRDLLITVLQRYGAVATAAGSAAEALELLDELKPDLLFSDVGMPGEDGYALIQKVRARSPERGGRVPAVALTAYAKAEDRIDV